jgi:hypothetical protein
MKAHYMMGIRGTIKNGQVMLDQTGQFPDGMRVLVLPADANTSTHGMREDDWPTTPEGIAALLQRMDQLEPGWLTPEDELAWRTALHEQTHVEKAKNSEDSEKLRRMWE